MEDIGKESQGLYFYAVIIWFMARFAGFTEKDIADYRATALLYTAFPGCRDGNEEPLYWDGNTSKMVNETRGSLVRGMNLDPASVSQFMRGRPPEDINVKYDMAVQLGVDVDDIQKTPLVDVLTALAGTPLFVNLAKGYAVHVIKTGRGALSQWLPLTDLDRYALRLAETAYARSRYGDGTDAKLVAVKVTQSRKQHELWTLDTRGAGTEDDPIRLVGASKHILGNDPHSVLEKELADFAGHVLPVASRNFQAYRERIRAHDPRLLGEFAGSNIETGRVLGVPVQ
jgi:hypothetical protein